jgi:hypothetical protein
MAGVVKFEGQPSFLLSEAKSARARHAENRL